MTDDAWIINKKGKRSRRMTTKGWVFEVQWRDGTSSWVSLRELKENNPIEVAEYVQSVNILHKPALAWWAKHTLKKRDRII